MNELEKIVSLASEIEIAEKDADIVCDVDESNYYHQEYLPSLYQEMNLAYVNLVKKLYDTKKQTLYRYQLSF